MDKAKRLIVNVATQAEKKSIDATKAQITEMVQSFRNEPLKIQIDFDERTAKKVREEIWNIQNSLTLTENEIQRYNKELKDSGSNIKFGEKLQDQIVSVIKLLDQMRMAFKSVGGKNYLDVRVDSFSVFISLLTGAKEGTKEFNDILSKTVSNGGIISTLENINKLLAGIAEQLNIKNLPPIETITKQISEQTAASESATQALANYRKSLLDAFSGDTENSAEALKKQIESISAYFNSNLGSKMAGKALSGGLDLTNVNVKFIKELSAAMALPEAELEKITFQIGKTTHSLKELSEVDALGKLNIQLTEALSNYTKISNQIKKLEDKKMLAAASGDTKAVVAYTTQISKLKGELGALTKSDDLAFLKKIRTALGGEFISDINKAEQAITDLTAKEKEIQEYNDRGFSIKSSSINELKDAIISIGQLNTSIEEGATLGFKQEQIDSVVSAFEKLRDVVQQIYDLLNGAGNLEVISKGLLTLNKETSAVESSVENIAHSAETAQANQSGRNLANEALSGIQNEQESNSPSKKAEELGRDLGEGYNLGIQETIQEISETTNEFQDKINKLLFEKDLGKGNQFDQLTKSGVEEYLQRIVEQAQKAGEEVSKAFLFEDTSGQLSFFNNIQEEAKETTTAIEEVAKAEEQIKGQLTLDDWSKNLTQQTQQSEKQTKDSIKRLTSELDKLQDKITKLSASGDAELVPEQFNAFVQNVERVKNSLSGGISAQEAQKELRDLKDESIALAEEVKKVKKELNGIASRSKVDLTIEIINKTLQRNKKFSADAVEELRTLQSTLRHGMPTDELKKVEDEIKRIVAEEEAAGNAGATWGEKWKKQLGNLTRYLSTFVSFYKIIDIGKQGVQTVIDLDSAITELRKVSDAPEERLVQSFEKSSQTAKELGQTISDVIGITADWSRLNRIGLLYGNI